MHDRIVGIIPARMGSTRFPGKPLAPLLGRPMIEHVLRRAEMCTQLDAVYVATCDEEIKKVVEALGGGVIMTSPTHERASDRVAEAAEQVEAGIVVMIQGDEPMITPAMIRGVRESGPAHYKSPRLLRSEHHQSRHGRKPRCALFLTRANPGGRIPFAGLQAGLRNSLPS